MEAVPWAIEALVAVVVACAVLIWVRGRVSGSGLRDFLGITATFLVLVWVAFAMIVGEHLLG